jgi:hypothetical protein
MLGIAVDTRKERLGIPERSALRRLVGRVAGGTVRPNTILVLRACAPHPVVTIPQGVSAIRLRGSDSQAVVLARAAMRAAEDDGEDEVSARFLNGHELFGWTADDGSIVCFGWVCFRNRAIGPQRLCDAPGRAFIYNCHTRAAFRRRGLYTALLRYLRAILAAEHLTEFIIDVNRRNPPSRRGIERAGFHPVASLTAVTLLKRWDFVVSRRVYDAAAVGTLIP